METNLSRRGFLTGLDAEGQRRAGARGSDKVAIDEDVLARLVNTSRPVRPSCVSGRNLLTHSRVYFTFSQVTAG